MVQYPIWVPSLYQQLLAHSQRSWSSLAPSWWQSLTPKALMDFLKVHVILTDFLANIYIFHLSCSLNILPVVTGSYWGFWKHLLQLTHSLLPFFRWITNLFSETTILSKGPLWYQWCRKFENRREKGNSRRRDSRKREKRSR